MTPRRTGDLALGVSAAVATALLTAGRCCDRGGEAAAQPRAERQITGTFRRATMGIATAGVARRARSLGKEIDASNEAAVGRRRPLGDVAHQIATERHGAVTRPARVEDASGRACGEDQRRLAERGAAGAQRVDDPRSAGLISRHSCPGCSGLWRCTGRRHRRPRCRRLAHRRWRTRLDHTQQRGSYRLACGRLRRRIRVVRGGVMGRIQRSDAHVRWRAVIGRGRLASGVPSGGCEHGVGVIVGRGRGLNHGGWKDRAAAVREEPDQTEQRRSRGEGTAKRPRRVGDGRARRRAEGRGRC